MLIPHTDIVAINEVIGHGVIATRPIPRGTVTWVRSEEDREFTLSEIDALSHEERETMLTYSYRTARGTYFHCGDNTKFINHSFNPNCLLTPYGFEIAIRDIAEGEELTNDYGMFNIIDSFEPVYEECARTVVHPDDLTRYHEQWDRMIHNALLEFPSVDQPLASFLSSETLEICHTIAQEKMQPESVRVLSLF